MSTAFGLFIFLDELRRAACQWKGPKGDGYDTWEETTNIDIVDAFSHTLV
jgi:hypothetical protein